MIEEVTAQIFDCGGSNSIISPAVSIRSEAPIILVPLSQIAATQTVTALPYIERSGVRERYACGHNRPKFDLAEQSPTVRGLFTDRSSLAFDRLMKRNL